MAQANVQAHMHEKNADQIAYWNGLGGQSWIARQATQEILMRPISEVLHDAAGAAKGERVVDIGCGCGGTTFELARRVGSEGRVLGLDISAPMVDYAREHAPRDLNAEFVQGDATVHPFQHGSADLLFSRFGVMFFADPTVSFTNLRKAIKPSGRLVFACLREPSANGWMMIPLQAVYQHVPEMPQLGPEDPGPFSFGSEERVRRILSGAGFSTIQLKRYDLALDITLGRGLDGAADAAIAFSPANRALNGQPDGVRAAATQSVRDALAKYEKDGKIPLPASIWIVSARPG
jgi:ubiquinone/menaquinone biosynthesis C-methylase UbiE